MAIVAITGITGLAGGHVGHALRAAGHVVVGISRRQSVEWEGQATCVVSDLTDPAALTTALQGCDTILHFADRADRRTYSEADIDAAARMLSAIRKAAAANGIRRIVAASSVYAERDDQSDDLYGRSKRAMEAVGLAKEPGAAALVLRLPPLHGTGAKGAVRHIARAVGKGWPLPFGLARTPRRFLSLDALADLCLHLVELEEGAFTRATGQIWVPLNVNQGSLSALARALGNGRNTRLLPIPGIDRLLGGRVPPGQLERDRDALLAAVGWQARD